MTNLEDLNLSFLRKYTFRQTEIVLLEKRDKFKASKIVQAAKGQIQSF